MKGAVRGELYCDRRFVCEVFQVSFGEASPRFRELVGGVRSVVTFHGPAAPISRRLAERRAPWLLRLPERRALGIELVRCETVDEAVVVSAIVVTTAGD